MKNTISLLLMFALTMLAVRVNAQPPTQQPDPSPALRMAALEKPLPPEKNPPGDIPDNQVFVRYAPNSKAYELKVPQGWARTVLNNEVRFTRYYDGLSVITDKAAHPPTVESVSRIQADRLKKAGRAVSVGPITRVTINGQSAVRMRYQSNSAPSAVTGKRVRLENETFFFYRAGRLAVLRLWAPLGADNVDQWRLISHSFSWR